MRTFAAPWERGLWTRTVLIGAVILSVLVVVPMHPGWTWGLRGALLLLAVGIWAWAPAGYRLEGGDLVIQRAIGELRIPLAGLIGIRRTRPDERSAVQFWANGGFCGYYGCFLVGYEAQTWYCTDRGRGVRLEWPGRVVVVSPSDPDEFLRAVNAPAHASR